MKANGIHYKVRTLLVRPGAQHGQGESCVLCCDTTDSQHMCMRFSGKLLGAWAVRTAPAGCSRGAECADQCQAPAVRRMPLYYSPGAVLALRRTQVDTMRCDNRFCRCRRRHYIGAHATCKLPQILGELGCCVPAWIVRKRGRVA